MSCFLPAFSFLYKLRVLIIICLVGKRCRCPRPVVVVVHALQLAVNGSMSVMEMYILRALARFVHSSHEVVFVELNLLFLEGTRYLRGIALHAAALENGEDSHGGPR